jgi:hypothetical protein
MNSCYFPPGQSRPTCRQVDKHLNSIFSPSLSFLLFAILKVSIADMLLFCFAGLIYLHLVLPMLVCIIKPVTSWLFWYSRPVINPLRRRVAWYLVYTVFVMPMTMLVMYFMGRQLSLLASGPGKWAHFL